MRRSFEGSAGLMCVPNEFNHLAESWKKLREKGFLQGRLT